MNYREGLRRVAMAALVLWEAFGLSALILAIKDWSEQPWWSQYLYVSKTLPAEMAPILIEMALPVVGWFAVQWIIRGFTPPSAGQKPVAATSSTSGAIERAEANLDAIREEMADRKLAYH